MKFLFAICIIIFSFFNISIAQKEKEKLEMKRKHNQKQIEYTDKILKQTTQKKKETLSKYLIINKRIELRTALIKTTEEQIENSKNSISRINGEINFLEKNLKEEIVEYKRLIYYSYNRRNKYNNLMYILSAKNFNQAYRRYKYLQQYITYRKEKILEIKLIKIDLETKNDSLEREKYFFEELASEKVIEKNKLQKEKEKENHLLNNLNKKEKELTKELEKQKRIAQTIEKEIAEIIKLSKTELKYALTPNEKILSNSFEKSKGGLPWPTERGLLIEKFGEHFHPVLKGIRVQNNGINIETTYGSKCRSIFKGKVKSIINIPGSNKAVIIRHGSYLTVYMNLINLLVKIGDEVEIKQNIGTIFTDQNNENNTTLHFEIWKENIKLNPEKWLSKK